VSAGGEISLFFHRVRDLIARPPVTCAPGTPATDVAALLTRERVGSAIVVDEGGAPVGIVTDRDLREKVVAAGRTPSTTPAAAIMSAPLVGVAPDAFAFEALLEMTRREIHHLAVVAAGRLVGVVSSHDVLVLQTTHPVLLAGEIARAATPAALAPLAARVTDLVRRLLAEGGSAQAIGEIVAEMNDRLVGRVLALTADALAAAGAPPPPVPACWLAFGSEARREQTLRTDQDNGLVYADPPPELVAPVAAYYRRYGAAAIAQLVEIGFPRCPNDSMASNPTWCQPLSTWVGYFRGWLERPEPEPLLAAAIYFDVRPLHGAVALGERLRELLVAEAPAHSAFLALLAREVTERPVPLTVLGNVAVRRVGGGRRGVDLKGGGGLQLVGAARVGALELGLAETNTVARFRAVAARGVYTPEEATEITDAFQHLVRLRLVHQLACLDAGEPPDNVVDPRRLSRADAVLLRDALGTVGRVQAGLRMRFSTAHMR
jgi:CBS domain-containing protein